MSLDIVSLLSEGDKRTVNNVDKVVACVLKDKDKVNILIECMNSTDEGLAMRAADALEKVFSKQPALLQGHTDSLIEILVTNPQKEVRWHLAQILPKLTMNKMQLEQVTRIWINDFYNSKSSIVKAFSLQAMHDVPKDGTFLVNQFEEMIVYALSSGTPAMKSRAKRLASR